MRVFLAGGTGVIGRPLIPQLREAGHDVIATTRYRNRVDILHQLGAQPAVLDALDRDAVLRTIVDAKPDAIIHQLTALPPHYSPNDPSFYAMTSQLRAEATRYLLDAARKAGVRRFIFQSICFMYKLVGPDVLDEDAPIADDTAEPFGSAVRKTIEGERLVLGTNGVQGVVLRYGQLYGPGTYFARDGDFARRARRHLLPIVGNGSGVFSFLHVEDAAYAAVCALQHGSGVYNVADDDPAFAREWILVFCEGVGAPKPLHVPLWLAKLGVGSFVAESMAHSRGASNAKAKAELRWAPRHPSWREGFRED